MPHLIRDVAEVVLKDFRQEKDEVLFQNASAFFYLSPGKKHLEDTQK